MTTTKDNRQVVRSKSKSRQKLQNEAVTIGQGISLLSSQDEADRVDALVGGEITIAPAPEPEPSQHVEAIDFKLRRMKNKQRNMFELQMRIVLSARALALLTSALIGVLIMLLKLYGH